MKWLGNDSIRSRLGWLLLSSARYCWYSRTPVIIYFNLLLYVTSLPSPLPCPPSLSSSPNNIDFNITNFNSVFPTAPTPDSKFSLEIKRNHFANIRLPRPELARCSARSVDSRVWRKIYLQPESLTWRANWSCDSGIAILHWSIHHSPLQSSGGET